MCCCDARKRRLLHCHPCANVGGHASQRDTCHGCHLCVVAGGNAVPPLRWRGTWELLPLGEAGRGVPPPPKKQRCPRRPSSCEEPARAICTYISKNICSEIEKAYNYFTTTLPVLPSLLTMFRPLLRLVLCMPSTPKNWEAAEGFSGWLMPIWPPAGSSICVNPPS